MTEPGTMTDVDQPQDEQAAGGLDLSLMRDTNVQILIISRMATKLGMATLSYGGMVYLARVGTPQWQVSLVGAVGFISAFLFGRQGGLIADTLPKRSALVAGYALQAALCFVIPAIFGISLTSFLLLTFLTSMLSQVVSPAAKAAVAVVTSAAALASVAALTTVAGGLGSAVGSAFLAPLLIKLTDITVLIYVAGVILALGAIRAIRLPQPEETTFRESLRKVDWRPQVATLRQTAAWLRGQPAIGGMVLVGAIVVALFEGLNSLLPVYVRDVLGADPANSIYIFAPAGIGYLIGMLAGPWLMHHMGERRLAIVSLAFMAIGSVLFGLVNQVAPVLAPVNPLRLLEVWGISISQAVLAAGVIAMPTNFGSTAAGMSVMTYINRRVPLNQQGAAFGMQEVIENGLTVVAMLSLGVVASWLGSQVVFIVAPPVILAVVVWLLRYSYRAMRQLAPDRRTAIHELLATDDENDG